MNLTRFLPACWLFLSMIWAPQQALATHVMGADLSFACLGGNQYQITLTMYRDCDGVATALPAYNVDISSASCGQATTITLFQNSAVDISPLCPALAGNSSCNGGPISGVEQYVYIGTYTFPVACTDWVISWAECCRNGAITNANIIPIANGTETYIEATLDNLTVTCNNSPYFTTIPTPYVCAGELFQFNHGAVDPDGDSLAFELVNPLELTLGLPTPVNYLVPFSPTYPVSTIPANSFGFDPATGQLTFTPDAPQRGITAIRVREYRNGKLIGSTMRDLQIVVQNCSNSLPLWGSPFSVSGGTLNGQVFTVCAGNTLQFSLTATDPNAANGLTVTSNLGTTLPSATLTGAGTNPRTSQFAWATSLADVGIHSFTLTVSDNACPILGRQTVGFQVYVQGPVEVTASDQTVCPGTPETIQLSAFVPGSPGNGTFSWSPAAGLSNPNIAAPLATVSDAASYTVSFTEGVCNSTATVNIQSVGDLTAGPDLSLCAPATVNLTSNFVLNLPPPPAFCGISANSCGGPAITSTVGTDNLSTGTIANAGGAGSPFLGAHQNGRTQMLFRASDLNAAGVTPGIISAISLNVTSLFSTGGYNGFTIRMGCTSANELTAYETGLSQVFTGLVAPVAGNNTFTLAAPYEWDGSSNLVLEFCFANGVGTGFDHVSYTNTNYLSVFFGFSNNTAGCNLATGFASTQRPNVSFTSCPLAVNPVYSWSPAAGLTNPGIPAPSANITSSVDYVLSVTVPGCVFTDTANIELAAPPALAAFAAIDLCIGDTVDLVPTGTNLSGTFAWSPATGLSNSTILSPQAFPTTTTTYTLTVTNACGSSSTPVTINVTNPPQITGITKTDISCFGANDGTATVNVTGAGPGFTYQWSPAVGITPSVSNLAPGSYMVTVTDLSNCSSQSSVTILEPAQLTLALGSGSNPSCNGLNDGVITLVATGGTGPYEYSIDGITFQASPTLTGLTGGIYNLVVRDANLCTATLQVGLNDPIGVAGQVTSQTNSDCVLATGSVSVNGDGGAGGYSFSLNGGPFQASGTFTGLAPGQYTITIQDQNGCTGTVLIGISANNAPTVSLTSLVSVSCNGGSNGSVLLNAGGGLPPYQFSLDGTNFQPGGAFTNLAAGNYVAEVNDGNGCPGFLPFTITEPPALVGTVTSQIDVTCPGGNDGAVLIFGNGGTPAYAYSVNGGPFGPNSTFNNLIAGTYTLVVRDANLCTDTTVVNILQPGPLSAILVSQTQVSCPGLADGAFAVIGTGGNGGYEYSLDGINFSASGSFTSLPAGSYTVTIRDIGNCIGTATITVSEPPALVGSVQTQNNPSCAGDTNGSVTLSATGGNGGYQFSSDGLTFSPNATFGGLAPGSYTFFVRDLAGCQSPIPVVITSPPPLAVGVLSVADVSCFGLTDGVVALNQGGGTSPYQYSVNGGVTFVPGPVLTGLAAGSYTVIIRDANNCQASTTFTIANPAPVVAALGTVSQVSCFGAANGSIIVSGSGGSGGPFAYSLNGGVFQANPTFTNLLAGNYDLFVADVNGCIDSVNTTITEPSPIALATTNLTAVTCPGGNNGAATVAASGGNPGYTFSWIPTGATTPAVTGLAAGTYLVQVTDVNNCQVTDTVIIPEPAPIAGNLQLTQGISCFGLSDASATVNASGGNGGFTYVWTTGNQASNTAINLGAGTHVVTITDALGCVAQDSITIVPPAAISLQTQATNVSCAGFADGSVTAIPGGGAGGFTFVWNNNPALTTASLSNLAPGTYTVVATDANGCQANDTVAITEPAAITLTATGANETCTAANGELYALATGGAGGFTYVWNTSPVQSGDTALGVPAGTYTVVAVDQNGCPDTATVTILDEAAPVLSLNQVISTSCFGGNDGGASVVATVGTGNYTFTWNSNPAQNGPVLTGVTAGNYVVTVNDGQCQTNLTVAVPQPIALNVTTASQQAPSCDALSDGRIVAVVSGGTPGYSFSWNTQPAQTDSIAENLAEGSYRLIVTDRNGCVDSLTVTLVAPEALQLTVLGDSVNCFGETTGVGRANVTGGTSPYQYQWSGTSATGPTASGLGVGSYGLVVTDVNGCIASAEVIVGGPTPLLVEVTGTDLRCFEGNDGTASATPSGGTGPYAFQWSNGETGSSPANLAAGTWTVVVTDQRGCEITGSVTLAEPPAIEVLTESVEGAFCDLPNGSATVSARGGTPGYAYVWNTVPAQQGPQASGLFGTGVGIAPVVTVTDANGCVSSDTVEIPNDPPALAAFTLEGINPLDDILLSEANLLFANQSQFAVSYLWDFGDGGISEQAQPRHNYAEEGEYTITLTAWDERFACPDTATLTIRVVFDGVVFIPNAFSPNGDGANDVFYFFGDGIEAVEVSIFDRWGRLVAILNSPAEGWDGTMRDGGVAQEGVYVFKMEGRLNNGASLRRGGTITLVR